jgi:hypothetical protein
MYMQCSLFLALDAQARLCTCLEVAHSDLQDSPLRDRALLKTKIDYTLKTESRPERETLRIGVVSLKRTLCESVLFAVCARGGRIFDSSLFFVTTGPARPRPARP